MTLGTVAFLGLLALEGSAEVKHPACSVQDSAHVAFRTHSPTDVLEIAVQGDPCYEAVLELVIKDRRGNRLYSYVAPFKQHTATHWEDPSLQLDAQHVVEKFLSNAGETTSIELPEWLSEPELYEATYCSTTLSRDEYNRLRAQRGPVLIHPTHYEGWRYVVFDHRSKISVVVLECGLQKIRQSCSPPGE